MKYKEEFYEFYREEFDKDSVTEDNTLLVFDTNALLNVFRFSPNASNEYLDVIKKMKNFIYIPYLVALEFHFNKKETLVESDNKVKQFEKSFNTKWNKLGTNFSKDLFTEFSFRDGVKKAANTLEEKLSEDIMKVLRENEEQIKSTTFEEIKKISTDQRKKYDELIELMESKTGKRYNQDFIKSVEKEGETRYKDNIPPGFNDKNKKGKRKFNGIEYHQKYGDLIIWKDMLEKAKKSSIKNVIFITNDGVSDKKSDLLYKVNNETIGARIEMIEEMWKQTTTNFFIMNELDFMKSFSDNTVSKKTSKSIESYYLSEINKNFNISFYSRIKEAVDVVSLLKSSEKFHTEIESYLEDYMTETVFELDIPYYIYGYGVLEGFTIQEVNIEKENLELDFDVPSISGTATVECDVYYSVEYKNPMYEKGEDEDEEFMSSSEQNDLYILSIEFNYIISDDSLHIIINSIN